jgi:hypothetical protein
MAKKGPNHNHHRDEPAKNTTAPTKAGQAPAPGRSGQTTQDHDDKHGTGQFGGAGDAPLIKK